MAEGYGDIKGVMLAEQPAEGRGPAGSPGGAPKAFRTAASVSHGEPLGLQPPVDRAGLATREDGKRSAAAKRGGAHPLGSGSRLHGNALTKHRKWLGALQRTMRQARDQWEAVEERAEARKSRFEGFSAALRATIRAGGDVQAIWPALGGDAKKATGTVKPPPAEEEAPAPAPEPAEDAAAVSFQEPPAAAPVAAPRLLLKELRQEEAEEIDAEMDALVRDALDAELDTRWPEDPDVDAAAAADEEAEEGGAAGDTAAEAAGEEEAEEAEAAAAAQARAAKKAAKTAGGLPAWALTAGAAEDREEEEEADLLAFAEGLDYDEFLDDLDASQRAEAEKIVAKAEAAQKAAEEEDAEGAGELPQGEEWKASFVRAMNHATNRALLEKLKQPKPGAKSVASGGGASHASQALSQTGTAASLAKSQAGTAKRRELEALQEEGEAGQGWDGKLKEGTSEELKEGARAAASALALNPGLRAIHSPASVRHMLQAEQPAAPPLLPIQEEAAA